MRPIRVLLADDHALVRAGIRALIDAMEGVEVVAEAGDGEEALRSARANLPDLILTGYVVAKVRWSAGPSCIEEQPSNGTDSGDCAEQSFATE